MNVFVLRDRQTDARTHPVAQRDQRAIHLERLVVNNGGAVIIFVEAVCKVAYHFSSTSKGRAMISVQK